MLLHSMSIKAILLVTISVLFIGCALLIVVNKPYAEQFITKNKVVPISEKYTELFIDHHEALPRNITPDTRYIFKFTIRNLEHKDMAYPYSVTAETETGEVIFTIKEGTVNLKYGDKKTIEVPFTFSPQFQRAKIEIRLFSTNQTIHFWVNEKDSK